MSRHALTLAILLCAGCTSSAPTYKPAAPAVSGFDVRVFDAGSGEMRSSAWFLAGQSLLVSNLRVGIHYQVELAAKDAGGKILQKAVSRDFYLDPAGQDVEQNQWLPVRFD